MWATRHRNQKYSVTLRSQLSWCHSFSLVFSAVTLHGIVRGLVRNAFRIGRGSSPAVGCLVPNSCRVNTIQLQTPARDNLLFKLPRWNAWDRLSTFPFEGMDVTWGHVYMLHPFRQVNRANQKEMGRPRSFSCHLISARNDPRVFASC